MHCCSVADRLKHEQPLDEQLKNEFMLQQLVSLISSLDLSDELARSAILSYRFSSEFLTSKQ